MKSSVPRRGLQEIRTMSGRISDADNPQRKYLTMAMLALAAISWFELAWLARHERIAVTIPIRSWLEQLSAEVRTIGITPAIADTAVSLPSSFPGDPADRLIYATAIENGWRLITKDQKLRDHHQPRPVTLW